MKPTKAREMLPEWRKAVKTLTFLKTVTGVDVRSCNKRLTKYKGLVTKARKALRTG